MKRLLAAAAISVALLFGCSDDDTQPEDAGVDVAQVEAGVDLSVDSGPADAQPVDLPEEAGVADDAATE